MPTHQTKDPSSCPLVGVIWSDLGRRMARFERLLARIEAGIPDRVRPSRAGRAAAPREVDQVDTDAGMDGATAAPVARALRLPTRNGWLMLMMPWVVAPYGSQLRYWLMEPEAEALVRSSRQMRRLLRPLLRSLSTDPLPECLLEPEAGEAPGQAVEAPGPEAAPEGAAAGAGVAVGAAQEAPADADPDADADADLDADADGVTVDDGAAPHSGSAAPASTGRVPRRAVARRTAAASAAFPCDAQAAQPAAARASACGFECAPVEPPPPDWWSVRDARRRAALTIARGAVCRA